MNLAADGLTENAEGIRRGGQDAPENGWSENHRATGRDLARELAGLVLRCAKQQRDVADGAQRVVQRGVCGPVRPVRLVQNKTVGGLHRLEMQTVQRRYKIVAGRIAALRFLQAGVERLAKKA